MANPMNEVSDAIRKKRRWKITSDDLKGYLFVAPALIGVILFFYYSSIDVIDSSFWKMRAFQKLEFWGFTNYSKVLNDRLFWKALWNTLAMAVLSLVTILPISLLIATFIKNVTRGQGFYKSLFFIPIITSLTAGTILFQFVLYPTKVGVVNAALGLFGIEPLPWFASMNYSQFGIVILNIWRKTGYDAIIWLAGLLSIPNELYEASEIDGANKVKQWFYITIPSLRSIFFFLFVTETIFALRRFAECYVIGGEDGNPGGSLMTLVLYVYRYITGGDAVGNFGIASAASVILFVIIGFFTVINIIFLRNKENERA